MHLQWEDYKITLHSRLQSTCSAADVVNLHALTSLRVSLERFFSRQNLVMDLSIEHPSLVNQLAAFALAIGKFAQRFMILPRHLQSVIQAPLAMVPFPAS